MGMDELLYAFQHDAFGRDWLIGLSYACHYLLFLYLHEELI
jgi:hypothetical protein